MPLCHWSILPLFPRVVHCSGCVTTAESVLLEQQSVGEVLQQLQSAGGSSRRVVVSVSPQSRAALAAHYQITPLQALRKLTTFLRSLGVWAVLDTSASRDVALVEVCREFVERYRASHLAPGTATANATTGATRVGLAHSSSETSTTSAPGSFAPPSTLSPSPSHSPSLSPSPSCTAPATPAGTGAPSVFPWAEQHSQEQWQQQGQAPGAFPAQSFTQDHQQQQFPQAWGSGAGAGVGAGSSEMESIDRDRDRDRGGDAMDVEMGDGGEGAWARDGRTSSCCQASSSDRSHLPVHSHSHSHSISQGQPCISSSNSHRDSHSFSSSHGGLAPTRGDGSNQLWQEASFQVNQQQMQSSQPQLSPGSLGPVSPLAVSPRPDGSVHSGTSAAAPLPLLSSACPGQLFIDHTTHN